MNNKIKMLKDELAIEENKQKNHLYDEPILNPENCDLENLYHVVFGSYINTGLIGFSGYVYAFEEQEALDRVLDSDPSLGISREEISEYDEDEISYGGNEGIPYLSEDLRELKLVRKAD